MFSWPKLQNVGVFMCLEKYAIRKLGSSEIKTTKRNHRVEFTNHLQGAGTTLWGAVSEAGQAI